MVREKIHYENNIQYLDMLLKTLKEGISLDIDKEYFTVKTIEDILFIDNTIDKIFTTLKENIHLSKRALYLQMILKTKQSFIDLINRILRKEYFLSEHLSPIFPKLETSRSAHRKDIKEIKNTLVSIKASGQEAEDFISQDEYKFLLSKEEE
ncbi:MAG: hypothetical protein DRP87_03815 [Spirochaetes bacterium]|nr:MAG: hypothetical protein DRP87_03815 [Spirochaetota bacterium]